jgi:hypothetical protein
MLNREEELAWVAMGQDFGLFCIYALLRALERGAETLPIDPVAWENTLVALEWSLMQEVLGRVYAGRTITSADIEPVRRLRQLGAEALVSGRVSPELQPLAERCMVFLSYPDWRRRFAELPKGFHVYPPSEEA